jgi:hypothetical protein
MLEGECKYIQNHALLCVSVCTCVWVGVLPLPLGLFNKEVCPAEISLDI